MDELSSKLDVVVGVRVEETKTRREVLAVLIGDAVLVAIDTAGLVVHAQGLDENEITEEKVASWLHQALDMDAVRSRLDDVTVSDLRDALAAERVHVRVLRGLVVRALEETDGRRVRPALRTAVTTAAAYARDMESEDGGSS